MSETNCALRSNVEDDKGDFGILSHFATYFQSNDVQERRRVGRSDVRRMVQYCKPTTYSDRKAGGYADQAVSWTSMLTCV